MAISYQQKCSLCRKNWVTVTWKSRYPVCYDCQKNQLEGEIKDPKMKKMFKIPPDLYQKSSFLRDIKINYLKYGRLTEKQIDAFKKTVKNLSEKKEEKKK